MSYTEDLQDDQLREWDWIADLNAQERNVMWLSRRTKAHYKAVYRYKWGQAEPPIEWLREAYAVLRGSVAA